MNFLLLLISVLFPLDDPLQPFWAEAKKWESEIAELEKLDRQPDPADAILLVGSSSIRMWNTLEVDMAPYPSLRRGFGGCKMTDIAVYRERLLHPHQYRALVVFAANDITGSDQDHTPAQISEAFDLIVRTSLEHQPSAPILIIAVTPTESRWEVWPKIRDANETLKQYAANHPQVHFVDTVDSYLNEQGLPRAEFFQDDRLHQNSIGYQNWARIIRQSLDTVLTPEKTANP